MAAQPSAPAPANVRRGVVQADYFGLNVLLSFSLNTLLAFTESAGFDGPAGAVALLETNALKLVRGMTYHALRRTAPHDDLTEDRVGEWLENLDEETGEAIGRAIALSLTTPHPTLRGLTDQIAQHLAAKVGPTSKA